MASFAKFERPPQPRSGRTTDRDLDIIEAILRYRFSPTSELVRIVGGNEDVTNRRLRMLWESGVINRFAFPFPRPHSEFMYYLDKHAPLELLVQHQRLIEKAQMIMPGRSRTAYFALQLRQTRSSARLVPQKSRCLISAMTSIAGPCRWPACSKNFGHTTTSSSASKNTARLLVSIPSSPCL
jgi:hypothetical protein